MELQRAVICKGLCQKVFPAASSDGYRRIPKSPAHKAFLGYKEFLPLVPHTSPIVSNKTYIFKGSLDEKLPIYEQDPKSKRLDSFEKRFVRD